jgi:hypothetical protein
MAVWLSTGHGGPHPEGFRPPAAFPHPSRRFALLRTPACSQPSRARQVPTPVRGRSSPPSRHPVRTGSHEGDTGDYAGGLAQGDKFFCALPSPLVGEGAPKGQMRGRRRCQAGTPLIRLRFAQPPSPTRGEGRARPTEPSRGTHRSAACRSPLPPGSTCCRTRPSRRCRRCRGPRNRHRAGPCGRLPRSCRGFRSA